MMKFIDLRLRPVDSSKTDVTSILDLDFRALHYAETVFALLYLREKVDLLKKGGKRKSRQSSAASYQKEVTQRVVSEAIIKRGEKSLPIRC